MDRATRLTVALGCLWAGAIVAAPPDVDRRFGNDRPARQPNTVRRPQPPRPAAPRVFELLDRNRDGRLSREELRGLDRLFDRLDEDRDGQVTPRELLGPPPGQGSGSNRRRFAAPRRPGFTPRQPNGRPRRSSRPTPAPLEVFSADQQGVEQILSAYRESLPSNRALSFYSLDWAEDLVDAKRRAAKENRPIFFIRVTNYSGPADFFSGHC